MAIRKYPYRFQTEQFSVSSHPDHCIAIDQRSGYKELLNKSGWPANEITLLAKLQIAGDEDSALAKLLERNLFEVPTAKVDNSTKTNAEIIQMILPKYCGTLSEYMTWVENLPLSETERQLLDKQAKEAFNEDSDDKTSEKTDDKSAVADA